MRVTAVERFRAWLMLATFVASLGSSGLNLDHLGIIDTACGDVGLSAGADGTQLTSAPPVVPQHCPVCHFLRAVSGANASAHARLAVQDGLTFGWAAAIQIPPAIDLTTRSPRGPPADTLTFVSSAI